MELKVTDYCYRCGNPRHLLSYLDPDGFKVPCWDCLGENKYEKPQSIETTKLAILDYYVSIKDDRYLQMFLVDKIFFDNTLPHTYEEFKCVLKQLQRTYSIDRNKIWFPDFILGYPKIFSRENIGGLKIVPVNDLYEISSKKTEIIINDRYKIGYPEIIPYDNRHHCRYNIFNKSSRDTKRMRLKSTNPNKCVKLFNILDKSNNSIFNLTDIDGNPIDFTTLSNLDQVVIKLVLLRNKSYFRILIDIVNEIISNVGVYSDPIFLKNTITVNPGSDLKLHIGWIPSDKKENFINISIL